MFRYAVLGLVAAFVVIRAAYGGGRGGRGARHGGRFAIGREAVRREGWAGVGVRFGLFWTAVAGIVVYAVAPGGALAQRFAIPLPEPVRWLGAALAAAALPLLAWTHHTLGRHWSVNLELREDHRLITTGPYARVRHPMYTALFGFAIGVGLVSASWLVAAPAWAAVVVLALRIPREERMMDERFGEAWRAYRSRTGALLPL